MVESGQVSYSVNSYDGAHGASSRASSASDLGLSPRRSSRMDARNTSSTGSNASDTRPVNRPPFNVKRFMNWSEMWVFECTGTIKLRTAPVLHLFYLRFVSSLPHTVALETLRAHSIHRKFWHCLPTDSLWSPSRGRCLLVVPYKRYCADSGTFVLTESDDDTARIGESRDVFHKVGRAWSYFGAYECGGISNMLHADDGPLGLSKEQSHTIMQKTIGENPGPEAKAHREHIHCGEEFFIRCCGLVRVGHNHDVDRAFQLEAAGMVPASASKRAASDDQQSGSRKKQKH